MNTAQAKKVSSGRAAAPNNSGGPVEELATAPLHFVLQHGIVSQDQEIVCRLLCSSKATAASGRTLPGCCLHKP